MEAKRLQAALEPPRGFDIDCGSGAMPSLGVVLADGFAAIGW